MPGNNTVPGYFYQRAFEGGIMKRFWVVCLGFSMLVSFCFLLLANRAPALKGDAPDLQPTYNIPFEVPGKADAHNPPGFVLSPWEDFFSLSRRPRLRAAEPPMRGVPD